MGEHGATGCAEDEHDRRLIANAHPPDWVNPTPQGRYNLVVLGAGTAGLVAAAGAAGLGAKVALIEKHFMGGDCLNVGCVPSKALLRCGRAAAAVRDAAQFGVQVPQNVAVDFAAVMERMRRLRAKISRHDSVARFSQIGVDVFLGEGRFAGPDSIEVAGQTLRFAKAVIATGSRPAELPIPGLRDAGFLTNETVFNLAELPRRLAVIGAGPIGCELSQAFARFGSEVFLVEAEHGVLPREDRQAAEVVQRAIQRDGVQVLCCGKELTIHRAADGKRLSVDSHGTHYDVTVDEILVAGGRAPNVEGLGLDVAGVEHDKHGVRVNDRLQTSNPRIYAAGDVCSRYKFTHAADALARTVIKNALFFGRVKAGSLLIPWCTYTEPEIAHVGLYPHEAQERGIAVDEFLMPFSEVDRAVLDGEEEGLLKVHVRKGKDRILGATLVARNAGDMISEISLAMQAGVGLSTLANTIHPYPTQAEAIKKAGDAYNRTRLTPLLQRALKKWFAWRR